MAESKTHKRLVAEALKDEHLQVALKRAITTYRKSRDNVMADFDLAISQEEVRKIKERCIANIDDLFASFKEEAEKVDCVVHQAKDGEEAAEIVRALARERGVRLIVKSKSMLTEEIELNPRLEGLDQLKPGARAPVRCYIARRELARLAAHPPMYTPRASPAPSTRNRRVRRDRDAMAPPAPSRRNNRAGVKLIPAPGRRARAASRSSRP